MKFKFSQIIPFSLSFTLVFLISCLSSVKDPKDEFVYVQNVQGKNEEELELNAKRKILENGLGEFVQGSSQVVSGKLKETIVNSSVEGFVLEYSKIGPTRKLVNGILEIDAKGKVNQKAVQDALKERYKDIGKPKFLVFIEERILGKKNIREKVGITENEIIRVFSDFDFLDKKQFYRILFKEGKKEPSTFSEHSFEDKILSLASESEAEILLVGQTEVTDLGKIEDTNLHSYQSVLRFKIFDVNTARIIAADNSSGVSPHINPNTGIQESIKRSVEKAYPKIKEQISDKWKPGNLIRIKMEGLSYNDYLDKDVLGIIRTIQGVNRVNQTSGSDRNDGIVLEIEALYNGGALYQKLRERKEDFGLEFSLKEVKSSYIHLFFKK
ncbi:hypothetical protein EHQ81_17965 [Leptospira selangorensis]|uniref:Lipoprotein n=1 Tax=Leptospira selangorensis TaxID=2484982 RepID=A0A5F2C1R4_9LEPT|nr:hypothetical protein [Leptospira selangorensis]TGM11555.1 hypothetical protein EHQ81_17965 [Leptospira selangorensis]TGM21204.1 hypothetical protein EHQ82_09350 [Leptospira selangorensis]